MKSHTNFVFVLLFLAFGLMACSSDKLISPTMAIVAPVSASVSVENSVTQQVFQDTWWNSCVNQQLTGSYTVHNQSQVLNYEDGDKRILVHTIIKGEFRDGAGNRYVYVQIAPFRQDLVSDGTYTATARPRVKLVSMGRSSNELVEITLQLAFDGTNFTAVSTFSHRCLGRG